MEIVDAAFAQGAGEGCLGETGAAGGRHGADIDQQRDTGRAELVEELLDRLAFIADCRERALRHRDRA